MPLHQDTTRGGPTTCVQTPTTPSHSPCAPGPPSRAAPAAAPSPAPSSARQRRGLILYHHTLVILYHNVISISAARNRAMQPPARLFPVDEHVAALPLQMMAARRSCASRSGAQSRARSGARTGVQSLQDRSSSDRGPAAPAARVRAPRWHAAVPLLGAKARHVGVRQHRMQHKAASCALHEEERGGAGELFCSMTRAWWV